VYTTADGRTPARTQRTLHSHIEKDMFEKNRTRVELRGYGHRKWFGIGIFSARLLASPKGTSQRHSATRITMKTNRVRPREDGLYHDVYAGESKCAR